MSTGKTLILNQQQIQQKLERMAYEIVENNYEEKELFIAGINQRGMIVAEKLAELIQRIEPVKITLKNLRIHTPNPVEQPVEIELDESINDKVVLIVDDVANTGRTLLYAAKPFLKYLPKSIQIAALVDRQHKTFPISCDYVGLSLATTIQEHITVQVQKAEPVKAWLE